MLNKLIASTVVSLFCLSALVTPAKAEFVPFLCTEESAINEIAAAIAANPLVQEEPAVATKYIESNVCVYPPIHIEVTITYRGMKFGTEGVGPGVIQIVGFNDAQMKRYYGLMPLAELNKGSI